MIDDDGFERMLGEIRADVDHVSREEAQRFLAKLDPDSSEGMWFDAFAQGFPTRLDAAVAYVRGR
jgi:hypothetical protein